MTRVRPSPQQEAIERYLDSCEHDPMHLAGPGANVMERGRIGTAALREALIAAVRQRSVHAAAPQALEALDMTTFGRARFTPMVRGLFPPNEQETVLDVLANSIVFLTPANIESVLAGTPWLGTAWKLANLYLGSIGADLLSGDAPRIVGLSEETTCYVSMAYVEEQGALDDYVVHEAAHIFHNCKRETIGLPALRGREWLLEIDFHKRETFAYACETYSRILACGPDPAARKVLLSTYAEGPMPAPSELDCQEYLDILREAVAARNGWKRILARCAGRKGNRR